MPSQAASPVVSPHESDSDASISLPQQRRPDRSPLASVDRLPYRRSNASLSNLFASTSSLPTRPGSDGTQTPPSAALNGSVFSPGGSTVRSPSPALPGVGAGSAGSETRNIIVRAFSPHVSVLASQDTEELIRHKGIHGGLLELLRPFGERVPGKVTIRDSSGASRSYEDYAVRFVGVKDGLESSRAANRNSTDSIRTGPRASMLEYKPARLRTGGDVPQIEDLVERHLTFAEEQSGPVQPDYLNHKSAATKPADSNNPSPFYHLYLRRLLSGLPLVPSETLSHPLASIIAISSRSPSPIEELRTLYASSNNGEHRLPPWVHNEFLRYYVLIHDEDYDSLPQSTALYDQMKRHFGLHCHLLRLRSTQCLPSDDDALLLPTCEWTAAAEDLSEITRRETSDDDDDPDITGPYIFDTDAANLRAFVRELVTQSLVPALERASATWNDQVASRRRGISGRFMSLSKRFTTFGSSSSSTSSASNRNSSVPSFGAAVGGSTNYDPSTGAYPPSANEATMRRLADYAMVLRDYRLAQSTFEILCQDFKGDKAWRHYAGANEMVVVSSLIQTGGAKVRYEAIETALREAYYTYVSRCQAPYYALRTLVLGVELLRLRGGAALDEAARWAGRVLEDRLVGAVGSVLVMERIAACYAERRVAGVSVVERRRKAAFWNALATEAWLRLEKGGRAEECLGAAARLYQALYESESSAAELEEKMGFEMEKRRFEAMQAHLASLHAAVQSNLSGPHHLSDEDLLAQQDADEQGQLAEPLQEDSDKLASLRRPSLQIQASNQPPGHRRSISVSASATSPDPPPQMQTLFDPLGAVGSAYETTPSTQRRPSGGGTVPLSAGAGVGDLPGMSSPMGERGSGGRDDGFE
ncbi:uncharacterized protein LTR77_009323 [Saxophila tyrrhenica]|uniref:Transport protein particle subunit trs85-2 n=1 Tax=Saxophila tyrrhenica TaxID=1690608 RepID=A0AAV9P2K7_9PEZI|nr:hypothetical protein LTR77_009323 [Saxophila tyrrhenica]